MSGVQILRVQKKKSDQKVVAAQNTGFRGSRDPKIDQNGHFLGQTEFF